LRWRFGGRRARFLKATYRHSLPSSLDNSSSKYAMTTLGTAAELLAFEETGREHGGSGDEPVRFTRGGDEPVRNTRGGGEPVRFGRGEAESSGAAMLVWRESGSSPPLDSCSSKYAITRLGTGAEVVGKEGSNPNGVDLVLFGGSEARDIVGPPAPSSQRTNPSPHGPQRFSADSRLWSVLFTRISG